MLDRVGVVNLNSPQPTRQGLGGHWTTLAAIRRLPSSTFRDVAIRPISSQAERLTASTVPCRVSRCVEFPVLETWAGAPVKLHG